MAEYSPGTVRVWHGKWQGMINCREKPTDKWRRKTKVLRTYHEPDPDRVGRMIEKDLPDPTGRITKAMTKQAEIALKEWRDELVGNGGRACSPDTTVGDYVTIYLDTMEASKALERSTMGPVRCIEKFIKRRDIANIPLKDLMQEDLEKFVTEMVQDGYQPGTVRKYFNVLRGAIRHAVAARTLNYDPSLSVRLPKNEQKEPNSLDAGNRARLVAFLRSAEVTATTTGISIALFTGMREAEVCGLRWKDVDLEAREIHVRNVIAHYRNEFYEKEPKTRAGRRDIPIDDGLADVLRRRLEGVRGECEVAGVELLDTMYVIGSLGDGRGTFMRPRSLWSDWKAIANSLGLRGMCGRCPSFHDLRHTFAVRCIEGGMDYETLSKRLGVDNGSTFRHTYRALVSKEEMERLERERFESRKERVAPEHVNRGERDPESTPYRIKIEKRRQELKDELDALEGDLAIIRSLRYSDCVQGANRQGLYSFIEKVLGDDKDGKFLIEYLRCNMRVADMPRLKVTTVQAIRRRVTHGFEKLNARLEEIYAVEGWEAVPALQELCEKIYAIAPAAPKRTGPKRKPTLSNQVKQAFEALERLREEKDTLKEELKKCRNDL